MKKMDWDKVRRERHGAKNGGSVVGSLRPINTGEEKCKFYSISQKKNLRKCKNYVSSIQEHNAEFCADHQDVIFHSEERGWRNTRQKELKDAAKKRKNKEYEKSERMLEHQMRRRSGR
jgi:hypothetical protein